MFEPRPLPYYPSLYPISYELFATNTNNFNIQLPHSIILTNIVYMDEFFRTINIHRHEYIKILHKRRHYAKIGVIIDVVVFSIAHTRALIQISLFFRKSMVNYR